MGSLTSGSKTWAFGELARRFIVGGAWNLLGNAASQALGLLAQILVARWLGKEAFGQLGMVYGTLGTIGIFASLGLGLTATKHVAEFRDTDPARAGRIIGLTSAITWIFAGVVTVAVLLASPYIAVETLKSAGLVWPLRLGCILIVLGAINTLQVAVLVGLESFKQVAAINLGKGLCSLPLLLVGAWRGGVTGVLIAYVIAGALFCGMGQWMVHREARRRQIAITSVELSTEFRLLWSFSAPAFLNSILWPLSVWVTNLFVIRLVDGYQQVGTLNAVRQWQAAVNFIPVAINGAVMPILASVMAHTPHDKDRSLQMANQLTSIAVWPVTLVLMLGAPFFLNLYGPGFSKAWPIFLVIMGATGVNLLNSAAGSLMLAKGAMGASLVNSALTSVFTITVIALTISRGGLYSVSYAILICNLLSTIGVVATAV